MIQLLLGSSFFRAIIWPIIKSELIEFVQKYCRDNAFRKEIDETVHLTVNAQTIEEKAHASKKLQDVMSRR